MTSTEILNLPVQTFTRLIHATDTDAYYLISSGSDGSTAKKLVDENRLAPLALFSPPIDQVSQEDSIDFTGESASADGEITLVLAAANLTGSPLTLTAAISNGDNETSIRNAVEAALTGNTAVADTFDFRENGGAGLVLIRKVNGADGTINLTVTDPGEILTSGPIVSTNTVAAVEGTAATTLCQQAIVTAAGGNTYPRIERDIFTATCLLPIRWTAPGNLFRDPDTGIWYRQAILPGGGGAVDYGNAYD